MEKQSVHDSFCRTDFSSQVGVDGRRDTSALEFRVRVRRPRSRRLRGGNPSRLRFGRRPSARLGARDRAPSPLRTYECHPAGRTTTVVDVWHRAHPVPSGTDPSTSRSGWRRTHQNSPKKSEEKYILSSIRISPRIEHRHRPLRPESYGAAPASAFVRPFSHSMDLLPGGGGESSGSRYSPLNVAIGRQ